MSRTPDPTRSPAQPRIEGGSDRHILHRSTATAAASSSCSRRSGVTARWRAGSGATWDLRSNTLRPRGWTSADAAGLPILPGLVRYREVGDGAIRHALRFTAPRTRPAYVYPARHFASDV